MQQNLSVITKCYDLLKYLITSVLKSMPKDQKFQIGTKIQALISESMELLIEAYYLSAGEKKPLLTKVNIKLEILRHYIRLCYEIGYYDSQKYKYISALIDGIGREVGGWLKTIK
jgi:hypothetical protein